MKKPFTKQKDFILCIDSDGTAMDTMNDKHSRCFAPLAADMWGIEERDTFVKLWNEINLYSKTRGINRFKGLVYALREVKKSGQQLEDFSYLAEWAESAAVLSNSSLEEAVSKEKADSACFTQLSKALEWSIQSNKLIHECEQHCLPFQGVKEALSAAADYAHIVVVSSANRSALESEWKQHDFIGFADMIFGQEDGSKTACIRRMLGYGFEPSKVLMIGDAYGDLKAADAAGVLFFPVLFGKEQQSWDELTRAALPKLLDGSYKTAYQETVKAAFFSHTGF